MTREFGKRGAHQPGPPVRQSFGTSDFPKFSLPSVEPLQLLQGAGFVVLGFLMANITIGTLFAPDPEYYKFVVKPPRLFDTMPDGSSKEVIYTPKERPKS